MGGHDLTSCSHVLIYVLYILQHVQVMYTHKCQRVRFCSLMVLWSDSYDVFVWILSCDRLLHVPICLYCHDIRMLLCTSHQVVHVLFIYHACTQDVLRPWEILVMFTQLTYISKTCLLCCTWYFIYIRMLLVQGLSTEGFSIILS